MKAMKAMLGWVALVTAGVASAQVPIYTTTTTVTVQNARVVAVALEAGRLWLERANGPASRRVGLTVVRHGNSRHATVVVGMRPPDHPFNRAPAV